MTVFFHQVPAVRVAIAHAVEEARAAKQADPLAPITFLLPRREDAAPVRRALGDVMGVTMLQFYGLGERILDEAGSPVRELDDLAARRLVRQCLDDMAAANELSTFATVVDKPGFIRLLVAWLREMKAQAITPEMVTADADRSGRRRDRQLAGLYRRYQAFLIENDYSDGEGLLWLAAEELEDKPALLARLGSLHVIGFDRFSPVQERVLAALAGRIDSSTLYLLWDADRPVDNVALTRLRQTRDWIRQDLAPAVDRSLPADPDALTPLRQQLFRLGEPNPIEPAGEAAVRAIAAPSREAEVRLALRAIKVLLAGGVSPDEIALLAPKPAVYRRLVQTVAEEYGLPVDLEPDLNRNPAVAALVNLLQLYPEFLWRPTFDALRSPYIDQPWLDRAQVELLDRLTRQRPVVAGREQWLFALQPLRQDRPAADDEVLDDQPLAATLPAETLQAIQDGLVQLFDHLSPPERASYYHYTDWLQDRLLAPFPDDEEGGAVPGLAMLKQCRDGDLAIAHRDLQAMAAVIRTLRRLLQAAQLVGEDSPVPWLEYRADFLSSLPGWVPGDDEDLRAAIRLSKLEDGRALATDYLYVLGLGEGEFPEPPPPDALYAPAERRAHPLPLVKHAPAEDASLWWQVISNGRKQLTMLRPRLDENGAPWLPSPYWQEVLDWAGVREERPPLDQLPPPTKAAGPAECLAALADRAARQVPPALAGPWQTAGRALQVMLRRYRWQPPAEFEGVFQDPALVSELSQRYGPQHGWSASRLNRYGNCPYGFFVQQILGLEPRPDPGEGLDAAQRGSLLHAILEALYRRLAEEDLAPTVQNQETVLAHLDRVCDRLLGTAPQRHGFRPGPLWRYEQQEMRRQLRALVRWECRENGEQAAFKPVRLELRFGLGGDGPAPLYLAVDDVGFKLHGIIDRLDLDDEGLARLIDYKSGSMGYNSADIARGLAFQTALYALAAERLMAEVERVGESAYWHIPSRKTSGQLNMPDGAEANETVQQAVTQAARFVSRVRLGVFPAAPGKGNIPCQGGCEFAAICRVSRVSIYKARQNYV